MAHKNRRLEKALRVALTGSSAALEECDDRDNDGSSDDHDDVDHLTASDTDISGEEQLESGSDDERLVTRNECKGKEFPLAHRLAG